MLRRETAGDLAAYEVEDDFEANELFQRNGWTDGLPIVAPTPERVVWFLEAVGLTADDEVGTESVRQRRISAGKVAVNAVMAGCLPTYMPVVVAIVQALCAPEYSLHGASSSTGGSAPFIIVNGPIRRQYAAEILRERYHVREVVWRRKYDFSRPAPAALLAELSACDAIIAGIGD